MPNTAALCLLPRALMRGAQRLLVSVPLVVASFLADSPYALAGASSSGAVDAAQAQQLFDEAKALVNKGDYEAACPRFAASEKLDPAAGTLLNLANCYEKSGRTASAWVTYKDAATAAHGSTTHKDWEKIATDRAAALEAMLARLTVTLTADAGGGAVVKRDGKVLSAEELGLAAVVDPGSHTVDAEAPGKRAYHVTIQVNPNSSSIAVIPQWRDASLEDAATVSDSTKSPGATQRTVGIVVGAVGIAGLAVGGVTGLLALSKNSSAKKICPNDGYCVDAAALSDNHAARTFAGVSTVGFVAGGALLVGGALLYLLAPSSNSASSASAWRFAPSVDKSGAGLFMVGGF